MIYFAQDGSGYIKIGFTEGDPTERLKSLQTGNPHSLTLLLTIRGDRSRETALHERFSESRACGEWFKPTPDLLRFMVEQAVQESAFMTVAAINSLDPPPAYPEWLDSTDGTGSGFIRIRGNWHDLQNGGTYLVKCPICGFEYNHLIVTDPVIQTAIEDATDGPCRVVSFSGECEHSWSLCFSFSKGSTYLFAALIPEEIVDSKRENQG